MCVSVRVCSLVVSCLLKHLISLVPICWNATIIATSVSSSGGCVCGGGGGGGRGRLTQTADADQITR